MQWRSEGSRERRGHEVGVCEHTGRDGKDEQRRGAVAAGVGGKEMPQQVGSGRGGGCSPGISQVASSPQLPSQLILGGSQTGCQVARAIALHPISGAADWEPRGTAAGGGALRSRPRPHAGPAALQCSRKLHFLSLWVISVDFGCFFKQ